ncbi:hypothetical protein ACLBR5_29000 [Escherichia coli]
MVAGQTWWRSDRGRVRGQSGKADVDAIKEREDKQHEQKDNQAAKQLLNNRLLSGSQRFMLIRRIDTLPVWQVRLRFIFLPLMGFL